MIWITRHISWATAIRYHFSRWDKLHTYETILRSALRYLYLFRSLMVSNNFRDPFQLRICIWIIFNMTMSANVSRHHAVSANSKKSWILKSIFLVEGSDSSIWIWHPSMTTLQFSRLCSVIVKTWSRCSIFQIIQFFFKKIIFFF